MNHIILCLSSKVNVVVTEDKQASFKRLLLVVNLNLAMPC